jgi:hypothetical protein
MLSYKFIFKSLSHFSIDLNAIEVIPKSFLSIIWGLKIISVELNLCWWFTWMISPPGSSYDLSSKVNGSSLLYIWYWYSRLTEHIYSLRPLICSWCPLTLILFASSFSISYCVISFPASSSFIIACGRAYPSNIGTV